jgi:hypothetical protein
VDVPPLAEWLRWIAERPPELRAAPEGLPGGTVRVRAVVADVLESLFGEAPDARLLAAFDAGAGSAAEASRLGWVLAAAHVLWHPALRADAAALAGKRSDIERMLVQELAGVGAAAPAAGLDADEERREELARRVLRAAGLGLPGESATEAEDRLRQVDSIERRRVLAGAAERERRMRAVREAMARKAAEEAAAKVSRE